MNALRNVSVPCLASLVATLVISGCASPSAGEDSAVSGGEQALADSLGAGARAAIKLPTEKLNFVATTGEKIEIEYAAQTFIEAAEKPNSVDQVKVLRLRLSGGASLPSTARVILIQTDPVRGLYGQGNYDEVRVATLDLKPDTDGKSLVGDLLGKDVSNPFNPWIKASYYAFQPSTSKIQVAVVLNPKTPSNLAATERYLVDPLHKNDPDDRAKHNFTLPMHLTTSAIGQR